MAQGRDEHRMVFDIRGRRGVAIKIVYAILALLMVASLFLVTGAVNLNTLFNGSSGSGESAVSNFQDQAQRIEAKLRKEPQSEDLLAGLTRTRINAANSLINEEAFGTQDGSEEIRQELAQASEDWSKYLDAAAEPSAGLAIQAARALFQLAEGSGGEAGRETVESAVEAQQIVAEARPNLNSYSTLAYYTLFTGDFKAAKEAEQKAIAETTSKFERENFENSFEGVEKNARKFDRQLKAEKASKAATGGGGGKEALEKPSLGGLGGLGSTGLEAE